MYEVKHIDRGEMTATPQTNHGVNIRCEICDRLIPSGEQHYQVQVGHGMSWACADHDADEIEEFATGSDEEECD